MSAVGTMPKDGLKVPEGLFAMTPEEAEEFRKAMDCEPRRSFESIKQEILGLLSPYLCHKTECAFWESKAENPNMDCTCGFTEKWGEAVHMEKA